MEPLKLKFERVGFYRYAELLKPIKTSDARQTVRISETHTTNTDT